MKNWEALKAVQDGYCVRHNTWIAGTHLKPGFKRSPDEWVRGAEWHLAHYEDGWEVCEPEEYGKAVGKPEDAGHDWAWACEQMVDGRRVRRKMWDWGYIPYDDTNGMILHRHDFDATDWILYTGPQRSWAWACEQMLAGKKVRRKLWIAGHWYQRGCADRVANIDLALADFKATDWVLVKPTERKEP